LFAQRTGYHADVLRAEIAETLSPGWSERVVKLQMPGDVAALAPIDLAVVKLRVGRVKDVELCRYLLSTRRIGLEAIRERLDATPLSEPESLRLGAEVRVLPLEPLLLYYSAITWA